MKTAVFVSVLLILIHRFVSNCLLHQLCEPNLIFLQADNTFWLLHYLQIPQFLTSNLAVGAIFDLALVLSLLFSLFSNKRGWIVLFASLILIYFITFHSRFAHHGHSLVGVLFAIVPFLFKREKAFQLAIEGIRYYTLFIYVSSAIWKMGRGVVFSSGQFTNILKAQNAQTLASQPSGMFAEINYFLLDHDFLCQGLFAMAVLMQLTFVVGFFTRKMDLFLIVLGITIHLGIYMLMEIQFSELWILYLFLLPRHWLTSQQKSHV